MGLCEELGSALVIRLRFSVVPWRDEAAGRTSAMSMIIVLPQSLQRAGICVSPLNQRISGQIFFQLHKLKIGILKNPLKVFKWWPLCMAVLEF